MFFRKYTKQHILSCLCSAYLLCFVYNTKVKCVKQQQKSAKYMETAKRSLEETSPETNISAKRPIKMINGSSGASGSASSGAKNSSTADCFSWDMFDKKLSTALDSALDKKLDNVVKKDDIAPITGELKQLRLENTFLKNEVKTLRNRLEFIDRSARKNNIVLSGISSNNIPQALEEFKKICQHHLKVEVNVVEARKLNSGKSFLLTLNSALEVNSVMANKKSLMGKKSILTKTLQRRCKISDTFYANLLKN